MTEGIECIYLETHNWGKAVKFWQQLGFKVTLDLGGSGRLAHPKGGPELFIEEVPTGQTPAMHLYLHSSEPHGKPGAPAKVVKDWHPSHWGTDLLELRDPDGRTVVAQCSKPQK